MKINMPLNDMIMDSVLLVVSVLLVRHVLIILERLTKTDHRFWYLKMFIL